MTTKVSSAMLEDGSEAVGLVPIGGLMIWPGAAEPTNWLFARGQAVSRSTYAALFAAIGVSFGAGDGTTTFNLPDLRGRVPVGRDNMGGTPANRVTTAVSNVDATTLGASGGSQSLQAHNHGVTDPGHSHSLTGSGRATNIGADTDAMALGVGYNGGGSTIGTSTTGITVNSAGSGGSENVQPSLVLNYLIRAL